MPIPCLLAGDYALFKNKRGRKDCACRLPAERVRLSGEPPLAMRARCSGSRFCPAPLGIVTAQYNIKSAPSGADFLRSNFKLMFIAQLRADDGVTFLPEQEKGFTLKRDDKLKFEYRHKNQAPRLGRPLFLSSYAATIRADTMALQKGLTVPRCLRRLAA